MKLLVVVVNYRHTDMTIDCLRSVAAQIADVPGTKVGICENGTGPQAAAQLEAAVAEHGWGEWAYVVAITPNQGFTGGNNAVIGPALEAPPAERPRYVLLLNNDTIVRPGAFKALVDFMDAHPQAGIAGSRLENPDGSPQHSAFRFQSIASEFDRGLRLGLVSWLLRPWNVCLPIPDRPTQAPWVSGASLMIRADLLQNLGLLDEGYFTYFDDIDLCLNARRAGWPTWYVPESRVVHLVAQTTGVAARSASPGESRQPTGPQKRLPVYMLQARRRYFLKNHGRLYAALIDAGYITGLALWRLRRIIQRRPDTDPEHVLDDAIRQSVFVQGFKIPVVENPAMGRSGQTAP
jgi:N-acetylglucosaminyl-diphospho-decaprenol L-rhamnosyltransferase